MKLSPPAPGLSLLTGDHAEAESTRQTPEFCPSLEALHDPLDTFLELVIQCISDHGEDLLPLRSTCKLSAFPSTGE